MNTLHKKYKLSIFGEQYSFVGDEHDERVNAAARLLDMLMRDIAEKTNIIDAKRIAVLAALQLAGSLQDMEQQVDRFQETHANILSRIDRLERDLASRVS